MTGAWGKTMFNPAKCKKCVHYYVRMTNPELQNPDAGLGVPGGTYNPNPACYHENPTILTQECYKKRKSNKQLQQEWRERHAMDGV